MARMLWRSLDVPTMFPDLLQGIGTKPMKLDWENSRLAYQYGGYSTYVDDPIKGLGILPLEDWGLPD